MEDSGDDERMPVRIGVLARAEVSRILILQAMRKNGGRSASPARQDARRGGRQGGDKEPSREGVAEASTRDCVGGVIRLRRT